MEDPNFYQNLDAKVSKSLFDIEQMTNVVDDAIQALQTVKLCLQTEADKMAIRMRT